MKNILLQCLLVLAALTSSYANAHGNVMDEAGGNETLDDWPEPELADLVAADAAIKSVQTDRASQFPDQVTIPVVYVVLYKASGEGYVSYSRLQAQVNQLNDAFSGGEARRGNYRGATDSRLRFSLHAVRYVQNDEYHDMCALYNYQQLIKPQYSLNPAKYYYVYVCHCTSALGLSWLPYMAYQGKQVPENHWILGSIIHWDLLPGSNIFNGRYSQGDIGTHETGHFVGLRHLYDGGCTGPESMTDGIADTPREVGNNVAACNAVIDSCPTQPGKDDNGNYMGIFADSCRDHFTPGQVAYMQAAMLTYKPTMVRETTLDCVAAVDSTDAAQDLAPCVGAVQVDDATGRKFCSVSATDPSQWGWACCPSDGTSCRQGTANIRPNLSAVRPGKGSSKPPSTAPPSSAGAGCSNWVVKDVGTKCQLPFTAKKRKRGTKTFNAPPTIGQFRPAGSARFDTSTLWCPFQGVTTYNAGNKAVKKLWGEAVCATSG